MADYDWFTPSDGTVARQRNEAEQAEREAWRTGFRYFKKSTSVSGFTPSLTQTECLGCGCLIANEEVHRTRCDWTPKVPKTVWVDANG